jgi:hypothetical protein
MQHVLISSMAEVGQNKLEPDTYDIRRMAVGCHAPDSTTVPGFTSLLSRKTCGGLGQ